jgi:hypothetical protein
MTWSLFYRLCLALFANQPDKWYAACAELQERRAQRSDDASA